jgi:hypothetical protein
MENLKAEIPKWSLWDGEECTAIFSLRWRRRKGEKYRKITN